MSKTLEIRLKNGDTEYAEGVWLRSGNVYLLEWGSAINDLITTKTIDAKEILDVLIVERDEDA